MVHLMNAADRGEAMQPSEVVRQYQAVCEQLRAQFPDLPIGSVRRLAQEAIVKQFTMQQVQAAQEQFNAVIADAARKIDVVNSQIQAVAGHLVDPVKRSSFINSFHKAVIPAQHKLAQGRSLGDIEAAQDALRLANTVMTALIAWGAQPQQ
jgi:hypothetical protein